MLSPCGGCGPYHCVLGDRKKDCLAHYDNLRRIGNSPGGFAASEESPDNWPEFERNFYLKQIGRVTAMAEETAKRSRGRPRGTVKPPTQAVALQTALNFVSPVQNDVADFSQYVNMAGNMATAYNGQMAAGHPIAEELTVCPHLDRFKIALKNCGKTLVLTETEAGALSVKGDKLRAVVPCLKDALPVMLPDAPAIEGDFDILKEAFKVCGSLASENADRAVLASLLVGNGSCTGTNGAAMLQFWHGLQIPDGTVIPKVFAAAIAKEPKKITGLGAGWDAAAGFATSFTVWFEGGAWLKTQCYNDRWPDLRHILDLPSSAIDTPDGLFDAVEAVVKFIDEDKTKAIHFLPGFVQSHQTTEAGAQYEVADLPGGKCFNGDLLKQIAPYCSRIDLTTHDDRAMFFGGTANNPIRGSVMAMRA